MNQLSRDVLLDPANEFLCVSCRLCGYGPVSLAPIGLILRRTPAECHGFAFANRPFASVATGFEDREAHIKAPQKPGEPKRPCVTESPVIAVSSLLSLVTWWSIRLPMLISRL
jgi:hypothetical protein